MGGGTSRKKYVTIKQEVGWGLEENKSCKRLRKPVKGGIFKDEDEKAFLKAKKYKPENWLEVKEGE